jgi:hypothetical protein
VVANPRISASSTVVITGSTSSDQHGDKTDEHLKNLQPALDIGSHINASAQPLPEAGATQERTL